MNYRSSEVIKHKFQILQDFVQEIQRQIYNDQIYSAQSYGKEYGQQICLFSSATDGVLLDINSWLDSKNGDVELQISKFITQIASPILMIHMIGYLSSAVILSEFGDFSKYKNPSNMLSFAGLEPG